MKVGRRARPAPARARSSARRGEFVSQAGVLYESSIKRRFSVKDSSNLIPGHGGFMDRIDGLVFAAVLLAAYLTLTH